MTEFQLELLRFLYYVLMSGMLIVKFVFLVFIGSMLVEGILSITKRILNIFKK